MKGGAARGRTRLDSFDSWLPSRTLILTVAVIAMFALTMMNNLEGTLRQPVLVNGTVGGVPDIASRFVKPHQAGLLRGTWKAWETYADSNEVKDVESRRM